MLDPLELDLNRFMPEVQQRRQAKDRPISGTFWLAQASLPPT
jgi:hypothetical protein